MTFHSDPMLPPGTNYCKCSGCGEYFGGVRAFEVHRVGVHEDRRCLLPSGMSRMGYRKSARGYWGRDYQ